MSTRMTAPHQYEFAPPGPYDCRPRPLLGACAIALAILFNIPYAMLALTFDYPDVLRRPAGEVLGRFSHGGTSLIFTWHAFALAAFALIPLSVALSIDRRRLDRMPALASTAAISGSLAGLAQAVGLWRWVFVVPALARSHAEPGATHELLRSAELAFDVVNLYGGVAIGEHLGQLLTALFALTLSRIQWIEVRTTTACFGYVTAMGIGFGTIEALAVAVGAAGDAFALGTTVGFLALSVWLIATGLGLLRTSAARSAARVALP